MDPLEDALKISHNWALTRIHALSENYDMKCVSNACAIHDEFREWFDDALEEHDVISLTYIGEGSEYV
tara:strand:- start:193 stop:396 length:204 start_codon:yes stop_codon:yes gene_type:complete